MRICGLSGPKVMRLKTVGKPLHEKIRAYEKQVRDLERACVANFSNEQLTRARVEALEARLAALEPKESNETATR